MNESPRKSFFDQFSPKAAFLFGIVSATAVLSLIGFFITATIVSGGSSTTKKTTNTTGSTTNTNAAQALSYRPVGKDDHVRGSDKATVTLIEYSDFQCPFCNQVHPTFQQVMKDYEGEVRWVFRHFPLESIHPQARPAGLAAECIADLGGEDSFWKFTDTVYEDQTKLGDAFYVEQANALGVDEDKFQECYSGKQFDDVINGDLDDAQLAGAQGTPYTLVVDAKGNVTPVSGALPYAQFKSAIDAALAAS